MLSEEDKRSKIIDKVKEMSVIVSKGIEVNSDCGSGGNDQIIKSITKSKGS